MALQPDGKVRWKRNSKPEPTGQCDLFLQTKTAPTSPPSSQPKTQLTPTVSPEQQKTVEDRRLRIDLTLSRLVALTEEQKDDIRGTIQNVLDSAKGTVEKEEGTYYVHEGDVKILKENINIASHDEFELHVDGDTIYFIANPEGEEAIHTGWHATVKRSFQIKPNPKRASVA